MIYIKMLNIEWLNDENYNYLYMISMIDPQSQMLACHVLKWQLSKLIFQLMNQLYYELFVVLQ